VTGNPWPYAAVDGGRGERAFKPFGAVQRDAADCTALGNPARTSRGANRRVMPPCTCFVAIPRPASRWSPIR